MNERHPLSELLSEALKESAERSRRDELRCDPSRAIPVLRDALKAWDQPCPFKRGDILKVASHSAIWRKEMGHVIVRDRLEAPDSISDEPRDMVQSYDMRILVIQDGGATLEFQAHSRDFELVEAAP